MSDVFEVVLDRLQEHVAYLGAPFMSEKSFFSKTADNILNSICEQMQCDLGSRNNLSVDDIISYINDSRTTYKAGSK